MAPHSLQRRRTRSQRPAQDSSSMAMDRAAEGNGDSLEQGEQQGLDSTIHNISLTDLKTGQVGSISTLGGGRGLVSRLASLGFTPGASVEVLQNYGHGPLIVEVRGARIALGRGEAQKVWVRPNHNHSL